MSDSNKHISLTTGQVLSSISAIQEAIHSLPEGLSLTPVKGKKPLREGWQSEPTLSIDTLVSELDSGKWDGLGLRTGDISGGLLAIDFDGPSAQRIRDAMEEALGQLPPTVGWKSGKPGRYQLLYKIPESYREPLKAFTRVDRSELKIGGEVIRCDDIEIVGTDGKKKTEREHIEFRYNNSQSVLPPSATQKQMATHTLKDNLLTICRSPFCPIHSASLSCR
ncbi:bifunctional DNA primase/polymerase [Synechocystis salina LEGE 06099]|uniref:bifunctional DNA primase/polymerase n=1 Tax=Synechocystis salina TaxID=945780 RepID=UPI00187E27BA|nr:bifunctional DNA primase/polymerase [Synechocystis salina]MBE9204916.1 bifunctional DNA primase/polymerase [Synechocystis salina LEGE 06099]